MLPFVSRLSPSERGPSMWPQQGVGTGDPQCAAAVASTAFPPPVREPTRCFPPMRILFSTPWVKLNRPASKGYHNVRDPIRHSSIVPIDHDLRKGNVENARVFCKGIDHARVGRRTNPADTNFFFSFWTLTQSSCHCPGTWLTIVPPATSWLKTTVAARSSSIVVG